MPQNYVMGNWKMNGSREEIVKLLHSLVGNYPLTSSAECVVFPPVIYQSLVEHTLNNSGINNAGLKWGAQNVFPQDNGAFTGEVSAPMLKDYGCGYVLVGHSERRHIFKEEEKFIAEKFHHVKLHDMIPVLCVGETLEQRERDLTKQVLEKQLLAIRDNGEDFTKCIIAYEPVWAIGTGKTAHPEQVQEVHSFLRTLVKELDNASASQLSIVYGGSVNEKNAQALFAMPDVNGGLVGGASLNAQQFVEIIKCIN